MMEFRSIQAIQSKSRGVHNFLNRLNLFNYSNLFFTNSDTWYLEPLSGTALCVLTLSGQMYAIQSSVGSYKLIAITERAFIDMCIGAAWSAVNDNQQHLRDTLERIELALGPSYNPVALF